MKEKLERNKKNKSIYFSDAMDKIDESLDFNEYNEVNSSAYFKETLFKAEDEVEKMMSSPLMSNFKKYKKQKLAVNLLKKNKDYIYKKIKMLTEKSHQKDNETNKRKKKVKLDSMIKRLNKINKNKIKIPEEEEEDEVIKSQQQTVKNKTISFLPKINTSKTINIDKKRKLQEPEEKKIETERKRLNEEKKNVLMTVSNSLSKDYTLNYKRVQNKISNYPTFTAKTFFLPKKKSKDIEKNNKKKTDTLENMYLNCIKGIEYLEFLEEEKPKLADIKNYNIDKNKNFDIEKRIYNKDNLMKKFLVENINALNKDKTQIKEEQIMKDYVQLKLKKDPIIKLSEKLAYFSRKPLLSLFHYDDKEEKTKNTFLEKLKLKDKHIMKKLDNDNRDMNLLMKRLDEDRRKYERGGYFIMTKDKERLNDKKRIKLKKMNINIDRKKINEDNNDINNEENYFESDENYDFSS